MYLVWQYSKALCLKLSFADLGSGDEKVKKIDVKKFLTPGYSTSGHVELYTVSTHADRNVPLVASHIHGVQKIKPEPVLLCTSYALAACL